MVEVSARAWFGAPGFEVTGVEEGTGEIVVRVQTPAGQRELCDRCGQRARSRGRREVVLRDAPAPDGRAVTLRWNKRVWRCMGPGCGAGSWTERAPLAGPRRLLTDRARAWALGRLEAVEGSVASAARRLGVSWRTVWAAVAEAAEKAAGDPQRMGPTPKAGFDKTVMASASRYRRRRYITAAVDAATGQVIDVFDGRDTADLRRRVESQPKWWAGSVEAVCIDPHQGYRSALAGLKASGCLAAGVQVAADPSPHRAVGEPGC